jgi:hypothetical protein
MSDHVSRRIEALDWDELSRGLDEHGFAVTQPVTCADECGALAALFDGDGFRSTIEMARHRLGDGRYRYFAHPLPGLIDTARSTFPSRRWPCSRGPGSAPAVTTGSACATVSAP